MEQQLSRKDIQRQQQRDWYHRNKEKVKGQKKSWYEKNRDHALAKNKEWREKRNVENGKLAQKGIVLDDKKPKRYNTGLTYFEILDILRKDKVHYLWGKCILDWTERDWFKFIELKDGVDEINQKAS